VGAILWGEIPCSKGLKLDVGHTNGPIKITIDQRLPKGRVSLLNPLCQQNHVDVAVNVGFIG